MTSLVSGLMKSSLLLIVFALGTGSTSAQRPDWSVKPLAEVQAQAAAGNAAAENELGNRYDAGLGVPKDFAQSFLWYSKSAAHGDLEGQFNLGYAYDHGQGSVKEPVLAFKNYSSAARQDFVPAINNLAFAYEHGVGTTANISVAIDWYTKAANHGSAPAALHLGEVYEAGTIIPKDLARSTRWYKTAADLGDPSGQFNYAWALWKGIGATKDDAQAVIYYRKAASQGNAMALNNLGYAYRHGEGVPQDNAVALDLFRKAAAKGVESAKASVAEMEWTFHQSTINDASTAADLEAKALRQLAHDTTTRQEQAQSEAGDSSNSNDGVADRRAEWNRRVDRLTRDVQSSEQEALDAESLANKYSRDSTVAASGGDLCGTVVGALNVTVAAKYQRDALAARRKADDMRAELRELNAQEPVAPTQASGYVRDIINTEPQMNEIPETLHAEQAKIAAIGARTQQTASVSAAAPLPTASSQPARQTSTIPVRSSQQPDHPTLSSNSPPSCATSNSGSALPMVPGTTASTCQIAACENMLYLVRLSSEWKTPKKEEVVAYWTNDSISDATCSWEFHKDGVWKDGGRGLIKAGVTHQGGEGHGMWDFGDDSSDVKFVCFKGKDPVDAHGNDCLAKIVFDGPTKAGTDK